MQAKHLKSGQFFWYIGKVCECVSVQSSSGTIKFRHYVQGECVVNMLGFSAEVEPLQYSSWMEVGPLNETNNSQLKTKTSVLVYSLSVLAGEIQSDDGVANAAIYEASERIANLDVAVKELHELMHRTQAEFVSTNDMALRRNREALLKHEWLTKL